MRFCICLKLVKSKLNWKSLKKIVTCQNSTSIKAYDIKENLKPQVDTCY